MLKITGSPEILISKVRNDENEILDLILVIMVVNHLNVKDN